ncbi:MAG: hypothetical protein CL862_03065 [Cyanobium sp. NAT70]|nr:hypothetical protein [Cyanobium sp. NAT70]|tara:strand:- start:376 stop:747 length:372 start_codon:yes stop_codon:yes gene_type:complete
MPFSSLLLLFALSAPVSNALSAINPVIAQEPGARQRAVNVARMRAEVMNGGLGRYRADQCMYSEGEAGGTCRIGSSSSGFIVSFYGGPPGWQQQGQAPTVETELQISPDGRHVLTEIYNGPPR